MHTAIGPVLTTAPETLPDREPSGPAFSKGDPVTHKRFGEGTVLDSEGDNLMVRFRDHGMKTVRTTYVAALAAAS